MPNKLTSKCSSERSSPIYDNTPCEGCYLNYIYAFNSRNGDLYRPTCLSYTCKKHSWKKKAMLKEGILRIVKEWDRVRFWTFTVTNRFHESKVEHSKALQKIWHRFVTDLRRLKSLTDYERKVQYIKVSEPHKSGYLHFHAFFDRYISQYKIKRLWENACKAALQSNARLGSCFVVGERSPNQAAYYVVKYATKTAEAKVKGWNLYSCSGNIAVFEKRVKKEVYVVWDSKRRIWLGLREPRPLLVNNSKHHHRFHEGKRELFRKMIDI